MLQVAICDDEKSHREEIRELVLRGLFAQDEVAFDFYESGVQLVEAIKHQKFQSELLFLDIRMPEKDGLEVATYIREKELDVDIFFVTVSAEHVFDGYTYNAFSYLLKPVDARRMEEELGRYMAKKYAGSNCLHVTMNNRPERILLDQVYYFEGDGRKIRVCQKGEEQSFYARMGDLEETLREQNFVRCHQSYLVNGKYIARLAGSQLYIEGETLPVSRKYLEQTRQFVQQRMFRNGGRDGTNE